MKWRTKRFACMGLILTMTMIAGTGCGSDGYELTDAQNDEIAEYIAGVLLKHDARYEEALIYEEDTVSDEAEQLTNITDLTANNEASPLPSTQPLPTTDTMSSPVPSGEPGQDANAQVSASPAANTPDSGTTPEENATNQQDADGNYVELSEVFKDKFLTVKYLKRDTHTTYPENADNTYFLLQAPKGSQYLVVTFTIANASNQKQTIDFTKSGIKYRLEMGGTTYKPSLTALTNDIQYLKTTIAGKESTKAIVVFETPDQISLSDAVMYVSTDDKTAKVQLN
ncbi:MAG: DUF4352 domain-containing protein [Lachnospiraceae bacterium]|nr:DUF4352 domain-containing protein [Lachnospiraceae bacterium]